MSFCPVELKEGVRLTHVVTERGKSDSFCVAFRIPFSKENLSKVALISKVLIRGTKNFPDTMSICRECEDNYGCSIDIYYKHTGNELTLVFQLSYLRKRYTFDNNDTAVRAFDLLKDFIFLPYLVDGAFDISYVEREKQALCERIASIFNNKPAYAVRRADMIMREGEPNAVTIYDCEQVIRECSAKDLTAFFEECVANCPVDMIYAGIQPVSEIISLIDSRLHFDPRRFSLPGPVVKRATDHIKEIVEEAEATQSTLVMGFRITADLCADDYPQLNLFSAILSLSPVSKLFMNVREKQSLCYYCNAHINSSDGIMMVSAGIDDENYEKTKTAILQQIEDIKNGVITEDELQNAIRSNYSAYKSSADQSSYLCSFYLNHIINGRFFTPEEECEFSLNVTANDAVTIAKTIVPDTFYLLKGTV